MKKIFVLALIILMSSFALSANTRKHIKFVDENGEKRTDVTSVAVMDLSTTTLSTLTTDEAATASITNPMTTTSTNTGLDAGNGIAIWCSAANSFDLQIIVGGVTVKFFAVTATTQKITVPWTTSTGIVLSTAPESLIWVSGDGEDSISCNGSFENPYLTPIYAIAQVSSTRKTVVVMPGDYDFAADYIVWPFRSGVRIVAPFGGVTFTQSAADTGIISINPTYTASTFEAYIENIEFSVSEGTSNGLFVNNTNMTKKLNVYLKNCTFSGEVTDESLKVSHNGPNNAIRVYVDGDGSIWEGVVTFVCANTGDRLRIKNQILLGGITTTGDVAGEIFLENTGILTGAITIDNDHKLTTVGCWYQTDADPTVYTECANAYATYE